MNIVEGPDGRPVAAKATADGFMRVVVESGGGGGGDASAANQVLGLTALDSIYDALQLLGTEATSADILAAIQGLGDGATLADLATALLPLASAATEATQQDVLAALEAQGIDVALVQTNVALLVPDLDAVRVACEAINTKTPTLISGRSPISLGGVTTSAATLAATGALIKGEPGTAFQAEFRNTTGSAVFMQIHDRITAPTAGARAAWYAPTSTNNNQVGNLALGHATIGVPCSTGIWLVASTTQETFTSTGSTNTSYNVIWQ